MNPTPPMEADHRFLRACRRLPVDRTPIWIMRQAGRYLPEYREVRKKVSFLELCKTPDLACEVTMQPLRRFDLDAAILFSDIMVPVEAMGVSIDFKPGPVIDEPIRSAADVHRLVVPDPELETGYVMDAVRKIRHALAGRAPLIGFAGSPFTLACYLVDGKGTKTFARTRALMYGEPATFHALSEKLADTVAAYLKAQVAAGAQAVQLFDSWVGLLGPAAFREFVIPHVRRVIDQLDREAAPVIYFAFGGSTLLSDVASLEPDVAGVDWRLPLGEARRILGDKIAVQGNLDPTVLFSSREQIERRATEVCSSAGRRPGHIFNLGHGMMPDMSPEAVAWLVDAVHGYDLGPGGAEG